MQKFKPRAVPLVPISAAQFDNINLLPLMDWDMGGAFIPAKYTYDRVRQYVSQEDWLIYHPSGLIEVMKDTRFKVKYEPIPEDQNDQS